MDDKKREQEQREHIEKILSTYRVESKRGEFVANGIKFKVRPVDGVETVRFLKVLSEARIFAEVIGKGRFQTALSFSRLFTDLDENNKPRKRGFIEELKLKYYEKIHKNYKRYKRFPLGCEVAEWVEKLVEVDNKRVRFYDLEKKYLLSKEEIEKLIIYICELSGFM
jgi:hypothetical protein